MSQLTIETFIQQSEHFTQLYEWIFENTQAYIKGRVLEIGSGTGGFSSLLVGQNIPVHLNDINKLKRDALRQKFQGSSIVRDVNKIDFETPDFEQAYSTAAGKFSTILAVNITEYLFLAKTGIKNAFFLLRPQGLLIILTPASTVYYPGAEEDLEDVKRQNRKSLKLLLQDFDILKVRFFNLDDLQEATTVRSPKLYALVISRRK